MSNTLVEIDSAAALETLMGTNNKTSQNNNKAVLLFCAPWHEATPMLQMVLKALAQEKTQVLFASIDAENVSDLSDKFEVTMVPTLVLLNGTSNSNSDPVVLERLEGGVEPSQITLAVQRLIDAPEGVIAAAADANNNHNGTATSTPGPKDPQQALNEKLGRLIRGDTVMLFMKGTPTAPRCGFSRQAVELLNENGVPFGSFDILSDEDVRQGLKTYSDWPTYPQIYVKGELIGGLDILKETAAEGSLKEQWEIDECALSAKESLESRLGKLVKRNKVMLFMKGLPSAPRCGFSRQIVEILDKSGVPYDAFNILEDEEVRQGLKTFSDWPTYPQLYVNGELVGGLDIVKELQESGDLEDTLKA
eukprot:CAMPEP_0178775500 /NCGR_PEP_ID=MMETSP0744-20121128/24228_1 /TAXON_ID=913974 /ORGANISM="Nitzschia punctata, Strain CCMP561" /LENGTH=362 /DNA_ID=CAMNT_0020432487 /DNA_START=65 /DNA_END=1153 /DNA_ORIENTATION=+